MKDNVSITCLGEYNGTAIDCRPSDEFVNATAMCQATGKRWAKYWENQQTQEFIAALGRQLSCPNSDLIQSSPVRGDLGGGTWVHRRVAINLAQWCSPDFAVWVTGQIEAIMTGRQVAHREHAEAEIANIGSTLSAMQKTISTIIDEMAAVRIEQHEQNKRLMVLYESLGPAIMRIDERTQGKREGFSLDVKKKFISCVHTLYNGKCPCCHRIDVVKNGKPIPYAGEHDHYHHRSMNRIEHGWFVCKSCNTKLKNRKPNGFWFMAGPAFQQFQRLVHDSNGSQMLMMFDATEMFS